LRFLWVLGHNLPVIKHYHLGLERRVRRLGSKKPEHPPIVR